MKRDVFVGGEALPEFEELQAACSDYMTARHKIAVAGPKHIADCVAVTMAKVRLARAVALDQGASADAA